MALFGKKKQLESEIEELQGKIDYLEANASPEHKAREAAKAELAEIKSKIEESQRSLAKTAEDVSALYSRSEELSAEVADKQSQVVSLDDRLLLQEFGLYEPRFDFQTVDEYRDKLKFVREDQKEIIRKMNADAKKTSWTVNGSSAEGRKMVTNLTKLLVRAFNGECDEIVRKVKFSNIEASIKTIEKSADDISKLGKVIGLSIPWDLVKLKREEAYLAHEFATFKEKEKENARELREQEREAKKLEKEIEAERKKLEKERKQYSNALSVILAKLANASDEDRQALEDKKAELEANLSEVAKAVEDVDYRAANQKAGYVYIISNIGSFGENVYKIGMTRRLDPMDRIRELSDASVPFNFDVHALIFSDDAPGLEAALHREFESRKLNLVNQRREFFNCSIDEIKEAVLKNYDRTVEFIAIPDAEQFRISEKMREAK